MTGIPKGVPFYILKNVYTSGCPCHFMHFAAGKAAIKLGELLKYQVVILPDKGIDIFQAKVNIEVQWTTENVIAAIERNGGVITSRFYDIQSVMALVDPEKFFQRGVPIPKCKLPPEDAIEYYTDPNFRGYLADPEKVAEARLELAQKYGYEVPDFSKDPLYEMLKLKKDPKQIFFGLAPGWVVNLKDRVIVKPKAQEWKEYYHS